MLFYQADHVAMGYGCRADTSSSNNCLFSWPEVARGPLKNVTETRRCLGAFVLIVPVLESACLDSYLDTTDDNAVDSILAHLLAEGNAYRLANTSDRLPIIGL
jgi:hypothetical protein